MGAADLDSLGTALRFQDFVSASVKDFAHQRAHRVFILYQQHRLCTACGKLRSRSSRTFVCPVIDCRKINIEACAATELALDCDVSAALLHDAIDRGQSEPRPLPLLLGSEERLENARLGLLV